MSDPLPRLRPGLDIFPSPDPERPGLVLRDSMLYSTNMLVLPPVWVLALGCLDGEQSALDVQALLLRRTGEIVPMETIQEFIRVIDGEGFLDTEEFVKRREAAHAEFREAPERGPTHAGSAYPLEADETRQMLGGYFENGPASPDPAGAKHLVGIAAPHVSPEGGWHSYAAAYRKVTPDLVDRTFVILGTSHYGEPEKFGLTRKPYVTPLGAAEVDLALHDKLVQNSAAIEEDYCHAVEHSIEFQVLFLQYMMQQPVKVLPILCGTFLDSLQSGRAPESQESVRIFFEALAEIAAKHGKRLFWLLGIDMAHMGSRYGDNFQAEAHRGEMQDVEARDRARMDQICAGDSRAFLDLVTPNGDDLKWCGYSPLYTFMQALPKTPGQVLHYEQWNIDPQSVVSFAGIEFAAT